MAIGRIPEPGTGIPESIVDAKGDIVTATAADTPARIAVGANETRLVADSGEATGLKYVADTTNYAVAAKGDLLVGTAADTVAALSVGTDTYTLVANSSTATGLAWAAPAGGGTYSTWSPTFSGLTVGNGTLTARYTQIGKLVNFIFVFRLGSTSSVSGRIDVSVPVAEARNTAPFTAQFDDSGVGSTAGYVSIESGYFATRAMNSSGTYTTLSDTTASVPFTWANLDFIYFTGTYEAA